MNYDSRDSKRVNQVPMKRGKRGNLDSLLAIGCSQIMILWIVVALVGYAVSLALGMGGSGQGDGVATALLLLIIGMLLAGPLYASFNSGHKRPFVRGAAGVVAWIAAAFVSTIILTPIREEMLAAVPLIATGAMLAIVLPQGGLRGNLIRIAAPSTSGMLVVTAMAVLDARTDVPFEWWIIAMSLAYVAGLGAVYFMDREVCT